MKIGGVALGVTSITASYNKLMAATANLPEVQAAQERFNDAIRDSRTMKHLEALASEIIEVKHAAIDAIDWVSKLFDKGHESAFAEGFKAPGRVIRMDPEAVELLRAASASHKLEQAVNSLQTSEERRVGTLRKTIEELREAARLNPTLAPKVNEQIKRAEGEIARLRDRKPIELIAEIDVRGGRESARLLDEQIAELTEEFETGKISLEEYAIAVDKAKAAADPFAQAISQVNALMAEGKSVYEATRTDAEIYADEIAHLNELLEAGAIDHETYARAAKRLQYQFDESAKAEKAFAYGMRSDLKSAFHDGTLHADEFFDHLLNRILDRQIENALDSLFGKSGGAGGGLFGGLLTGIGALLGFADGGHPPVGKPSIVGERGPELFVPRQSGTIVPLEGIGFPKITGSAGAGGAAPARGGDVNVTNHFQVDARGATVDAIKLLPSAMQAASDNAVDGQGRRWVA